MIFTEFRPETHGFRFPNRFTNTIFVVPARKIFHRLSAFFGFATITDEKNIRITSSGLCGGMSFTALDLFFYKRTGSSFGLRDFHVRVKSSWRKKWFLGTTDDGLKDHLYKRQMDSFNLRDLIYFLRFIYAPDSKTWWRKNITRLTNEQAAILAKKLYNGQPVPLGLIYSNSIRKFNDNHQVVAYGFGVDATGGMKDVWIYDPNYPGDEVKLSRNGEKKWVLSIRGEIKKVFRGFFVQKYNPSPVEVENLVHKDPR